MEDWDDDRRRLDNPKGNESKKVVTPENKCRPENAQIHVNATLDRIYSPVAGLYLVLYATNHWTDKWYQANSPERDTGMFEFDPVSGNISEVHTYACVGDPGYVYMVGCLHEGFPSDDLFSKTVQPPFKGCVQIASICGATCGSGAIEPSFNNPDPLNAGNFHQLKAQAVEWVRIWLCVCMLAMLLAIGFGIVHIIMALFPYDKDKSNQTIIANAFGMVLACIQAWMLAEPCLYVMKGRALKVSMRHTELLVLLAIGVAVMVVTGGVVGEIF